MIMAEEKVRFHTKPSLSRAEAGRQAQLFLDWVRSILTADKYALFILCFKYPVATVRIMEEVFSKMKKVFDGGNGFRHLSVNGVDNEVLHDMVVSDRNYWATEGYMAMKQYHNSMVVVDRDGNSFPYHYILTLDRVIDFDYGMDGQILDVVFRDGDYVIYIDDKEYRKYLSDNYDTPIETVSHNLGYTPVNWFLGEGYDINNPCLKKSVVQDYLADLDHLLMYLISEKCADLYALFPMYWAIVQECNYETDLNICDGGALVHKKTGEHLLDRDSNIVFCPKCSAKMVGVGTTIDVSLPASTDQPFQLPPAGQIESNVALLEHIVDKRESYIRAIKEGLTGHKHDVEGSKAVNTEQVQSIIEGAKSKVMDMKERFERIENWTVKTKLKLYYGEAYVSSEINYGTEFYLLNVDQLHNMYNLAKKNGADTMVLDGIKKQIYETKYKDNPVLLNRSIIMMDLDVMRHKTDEEAYKAYEIGIIDKQTLWLKVNLSSNIAKFEIENGDIVSFGKKMEYEAKISTILEEMRGYMPERIVADIGNVE
jgi:hypothetical protein